MNSTVTLFTATGFTAIYLQIAGILLWNTTDLLERARDVIARQPTIMSVKKLMCQIPIAPDDWLRIEESPAHVSLSDRNNDILTPPF